MAIKVKEIMGFMLQIQKIMDLYTDNTLAEMLEDIYQKCSSGKELEIKLTGELPQNSNSESVQSSTKKAGAKKSKRAAKVLNAEECRDIVERLGNKGSREAAEKLLSIYTKNNLLLIAAAIPATISKNKKKDIIIEQIINYFAYSWRHAQIGERPNYEGI
jgi:hypothetical protein